MMTRTTIGEVAEIVGGFGFDPKHQGHSNLPIPFIKVSDFARSQDHILSTAANTVSRAMLSELGARTFPAGTIIFPKVGGALLTNKRAILGCEATVDNNIMGLIPRGISGAYLFAFMQFFDMGRIANTQALPSVNASAMAKVEIPFPPLHQQQAVAELMQKCSRQVREARAAALLQLKESEALANQLIAAGLTRSSASEALLSDVLEEVKVGVGNKWRDFPVLGATRSGLAPARERPGKTAERYKPVDAGTVFYNPMRILIGSIAFVDDDDEPGITSPDYVVLKGKPGVVDSRWFYYWLRSPLGERCIQSLSRGAVRERMLFNRLAEGEIELPDYDTQVKASQALAKIKPMRQAIQQQLTELELLPQKLLSQVFDS